MLEEYFDRCPVLPVDATVSMAKYASIVRSTVSDASEYEKAGDTERALLLYMRCMVLVCKTITAHPEYAVQENKAIRRDLAGLASTCLQRLEMFAAARPGNHSKARREDEQFVPRLVPLEEPPSKSEAISMSSINTGSEALPSVTTTRAPLKRPRVRALVVSERLVSLFERIAAASDASGAETVGVLAGRLSTNEDAGVVKTIESITQHLSVDPSIANGGLPDDGKETPLEVSALVIPSQKLVSSTADRSEAELLHETDVSNLLAAKGLVQLGWILNCPKSDVPPVLDSLAAHRQLQAQLHIPSAATLLAMPGRVIPVALSDPWGMEVVAACAVSTPHVHDGNSDVAFQQKEDTRGEAGSSKSDAALFGDATRRLVVQAEHVTMCQDPESVQFKLYDVRPLGLRHRGGNGASGNAIAG